MQTLTLLIGGSRNGQIATDNVLQIIELEKTVAVLKLKSEGPSTSTKKEVDRYLRHEIKGRQFTIAVYVVENLPADEWVDNLRIANELSKDEKHKAQIQSVIEMLKDQA